MSATNPGGLVPGVNRTSEIDTTVVTNRPEVAAAAPTSSEGSKGNQAPVTQAPVNTEATGNEAERKEVPAEDREFSDRASKRFQELANRTAAAEADARVSREMLQRVVNTPLPPSKPEEEMARQYRSFDPNLGYPTDPREYSTFVGRQSAEEARKAAQAEMNQSRMNVEMSELLKYHPDVAGDTILEGAIAAERAAAQRKGGYVSYRDAADIVKEKIKTNFTKERERQAAVDTNAANDAYVETTKGGSPQRAPEPPVDQSKMTLKQMEKYMKDNGLWDQ